jgi:hypothetical protein
MLRVNDRSVCQMDAAELDRLSLKLWPWQLTPGLATIGGMEEVALIAPPGVFAVVEKMHRCA